MNDEQTVLESYLKDNGLKMTNERESILKVFLKLERHFTAEELLSECRFVDPSIGQATVFRTIRLFVDCGLARESFSGVSGQRYEHAYQHAHHDHLICLGCGKIVEFEDKDIERVQDKVYRDNDFVPVEHILELLGYCPECAKSVTP